MTPEAPPAIYTPPSSSTGTPPAIAIAPAGGAATAPPAIATAPAGGAATAPPEVAGYISPRPTIHVTGTTQAVLPMVPVDVSDPNDLGWAAQTNVSIYPQSELLFDDWGNTWFLYVRFLDDGHLSENAWLTTVAAKTDLPPTTGWEPQQPGIGMPVFTFGSTTPPAIATAPSGGAATAPPSIATAPSGGAATAPPAIATAPAGGAATAPPAIATAPAGGAATAPPAIFVP